MTDDTQAREIFLAGQELLEALHPAPEHVLERFDAFLGDLYEAFHLAHSCCDRCDADCPESIKTHGLCPSCVEVSDGTL